MQLKSLEDTQNFSKNISKIISAGDIVFLYGEIGVGKTTFVRFFINHLENRNRIKNSEVLSPTFNILYDYEVRNIKILHYDLYRLKNYKDISQLGMFETSNNSIKIVKRAIQGIKQIYRNGYRYKKVGIILHELHKESEMKGLLDIDREKSDFMMKTIDQINHKYGCSTLQLASEGISKSWSMRREKISPNYTTNFDHLMIVKC